MDESEVIHEVAFWPGSPLSYTTTKISVFRDAALLSSATGFVYRFAGHYFLVTNYHVLSGTHPATGAVLSRFGATPNRIEFHVAVASPVNEPGKVGEGLFFKPMSVPIVDNSELPLWFDDRPSGRQNDYAVMSLEPLLPELAQGGVSLRAIQGGRVTLKRGVEKPKSESDLLRADSAQHFYPSVGSTVFVLGYPLGIDSTGIFPIWKGATIASEPFAGVTLPSGQYENLFYIDGTTKSGMSGSPVIVIGNAGDLFYTEDNVVVEFATAESFLIGVYAGRDGLTNDEYELSLGRVWKVSALEALCMRTILANALPPPSLPSDSATSGTS